MPTRISCKPIDRELLYALESLRKDALSVRLSDPGETVPLICGTLGGS